MISNRTGNNKFLKRYNQTQILDLIRDHRQISRAELSEITGLSPTAIGGIVSHLIKNEYIHEIGIGESRGGRRPTLLELKPDSYYTIGIDIDMNYINIILIDITAQIKYKDAISFKDSTPFDTIMKSLYELIEYIIRAFHIKRDKLIGIGISIAGLVETVNDRVILAPNIGWENLELGREIKQAFPDIPIYVENESRASAIFENWIGVCQGDRDFICINIESGIGAGIFTEGRLYKGALGSAGEIGHITVDENGPKCGCGNYGCLETLASVKSIVEIAKKIIRQGSGTTLNNINNIENMTIDHLVKAAENGDRISINILMESARYLGIAISSLVNILNPSKIVIGKEFVKYSDLVLHEIINVVKRKSLNFPASRVEIITSRTGRDSSTIGAAIIPLKLLFGR